MFKKRNLKLVLVMLLMVSLLMSACSSSAPASTESASASETTTESSTSTDTPKEMDKMTIQLKWLPQSQFMGYYMAASKGYYEDEGIDIEILPGGSDIIPEQQVYNGVADVGVTWVSSLLKYQSQGWELKEVAQVFQKSAMLLVSKAETGITSPEDLVGKKVGSWFGGNEYEIYALLEANGIDREKDLELVQQDFTMNQILNDEIDAASAMTYNEYGLLLESGLSDADLNVLDMNDEGVAMLEDCLFVTDEWIAENEDLFVRFLRASIKGWQDACADPEAAGQVVYDADQSVSLEHQVYMAKEIAKLVTPEGFDPAKIGYIDMDAIQQTADLAYKYGLLTEPAVLDDTTITSKYFEEATK
ncbi:ABC transporter substrate-binding protein [Fusibacter paucivorans]|uniref:Thiamine pyrimidine synthase n=1 Tax=Fusibacter paucivorans TaxID=76009 RepID=A0ABS5PLF8_9FIRM|nr:ABC transporter substrate-binding protein [Fusibacter paucivorans]MBS7525989.1 ABC transporter substrate-binding protein [Fusibacter paucivorans]